MARYPADRRRVLADNLRLLRRSPMLLLISGVLTLCALSTCVFTGVILANRANQVPSPFVPIIVTAPPASDNAPGAVPTVAAPAIPPGGPAWVAAQLVRVVDGDTLIVAFNGTQPRLRLIGMDTPETVHPTKPVQCFGAEATRRTTAILNGVGGQVWLEKDVSETDRYGRLLRYVWLGPTPASPMLNEQLVAEGYAAVSTFPPDVKYQDRFLVAERAARAANSGLWGRCGGFGLPLAAPVPTVPNDSQ